MNKDHPHYAVWRESIERVLAGKPHGLQVRLDSPQLWHDVEANLDCTPSTSWHSNHKFRIKPDIRIVFIDGVELEGPLLEAPVYEADYWIVDAEGNEQEVSWLDDSTDKRLLAAGSVYRTKKAALAMFEAQRNQRMGAI